MKFIFICDQTNIGATPYIDLFVITSYKTIYIYIYIYIYLWLFQSTQEYSYCCPMIITWIILVYARNTLEHRTSDFVHIIRDLKSLMCFYSLSVKYTQVLLNFHMEKNIFLMFYIELLQYSFNVLWLKLIMCFNLSS